MAEFDPDAFLATPAAPTGGFDPDAFLRQGAAPTQGTSHVPKFVTDAASHLPAAITDIPKEIYEAGASGLHEMNAVNPWGQERTEARARREVPGPYAVPRAVAGTLALAGSPITGTARSVGGHLLELLNSGMRAGAVKLYGEDKVRQAEAAAGHPVGGGGYEQAKHDADALMMGLGPKGGMRAPPGVAPPPIPPPQADMLGVMLSEGQRTGELPLIRREQAAARGQLGPSAEQQAGAFNEQQQAQVGEAANRVRGAFDPFGQVVAQTPQEGAGVVSTALRDTAGQQRALAETNAQSLSSGIENLPHPLDAADTVANSLRDVHQHGQTAAEMRAGQLVTQREAIRENLNPAGGVVARSPQEAADIVSGAVGNQAENAQAATRAAYQQLRDLPGHFHPATFNRVGQSIREQLNAGTEPIRVSQQTTPIANSALGDLDEILGTIRQARDENGRVLPRAPITPALLDDTRKRLNSFLGDAIASARSSNNWSDVRAMRGIMNGFDDYVVARLDRGTFIGGDASSVLDTMRNARALHADYRRTFTPQGPGDTVGSAIQNIVGRYEGQAAPPAQIAQWLYGSGAMPVKIARRLLGIFGEEGPEASALRQGYLSHIIERPEGVTAWGPEQVADRIYNALNGPGKALTESYFPAQVRTQLRTYADSLRQSVEPDVAATDVVTRTINRIVGQGGQPAASGEVADLLFGRSVTGSSPTGVKVAQHIRDTQGEDSPAFTAMRQGVLSRLTNASAGAAGFDAEATAQRIRQFMDGGRRMAETLFNPQERAALGDYATSLEQHAASAALPADEVERTMARIGGRHGEPATPTEVADLLYGRAGAGDRGVSVRLAQRLKNEFGTSSPEWSAVKQGMFSRLIEPAEGKLDWGSQKISERLHEFLNGNGRPMAEAMFDPAERDMLRQFAELQKKLIVPPTGANRSETSTFLAPILRKIGSKIGLIIGAGAGHFIAPGLPWGVSEAVGAGVAKGVGAIGNAMDARKIAQQMPLIAQRMAAYQRALAAQQRANAPLSNRTASVALANLSKSLQPLGIDAYQLVPTRADEEKRQRGGRLEGKPDQGEGGKAKRADGGEVEARNAPYVRPIPSTYSTDLGAMEPMFRAWVAKNKVPFDPDAATSDYDMRGFYRAMTEGDPRAVVAQDPNDRRPHFTDPWKTPSHPTFGAQSQWATPDAPQWNEKDQLVDQYSGRIIYDDKRANDPDRIPGFAHGGRVDAANIDHAPTEAQKKAGNYAKDHVHIHGLDITIENAKGATRSGVDRGGKPWSVKMPAHYGYIKGTVGKDKDHVDVYVGPHPKSPRVFVVDQIDAESARFDEHKAFLGFASEAQAKRAYLAAFSDGLGHRRLGHMAQMSVDAFKRWLDGGDTTKRIEGAEHEHKLTHKVVGYIPQSRTRNHCGVCSMFREGPHCVLVADPINPAGWCRRFDPKE